LVVFALALALGLLIGLSWLRLRKVQPAPSAASAATTLDPQHRPLPAPMSGDPSALPAQTTQASSAAHIEPTPAPAQSVATVSTSVPDVVVPDATPPASADSEAQIVERKQPDYPIEAVRAQDEGVVRLQIALDALGNVEDVRVVQTSHSGALDNAAKDAARNWKFRPAMHDGQPVSSTIEVPVEFRLEEH
jgi:protein TonB